MIHELARALTVATSTDVSELERLRAHEHYTRLIGRLNELHTETGTVSLKWICFNLQTLLGKTFSIDESLSAIEQNFLKAWPCLLMSFIDAPAATQSFEVLLSNVRDANRKNPLTDDEVDGVENYLLGASTAEELKQGNGQGDDAVIPTAGFIQLLTEKITVLDKIVSAMPGERHSTSKPDEIYKQCTVQLADISAFSQQCGFLGLAEICLGVCDVLRVWIEQSGNACQPKYDFLTELPSVLGDAIKYRNDPEVGQTLVDFIYNRDVMPDVSDEHRAILRDFVLKDFDVSDWTQRLGTPTSKNGTKASVSRADTGEVFEMSVESLLREIDDSMGDIWDEYDELAARDSGFTDKEQQLIDILCAELMEIKQAKDAILELVGNPDASSTDRADALERYATSIGHIANAADMIDLKGLRDSAKFIASNITELSSANRVITQSECELLALWPDIFHAYLIDIHNPELAHALAGMLENPGWLSPMRAADLQLVIARLQKPSIRAGDDQQPRKVRVESEDISLTLPEDVNPELLEGMLQELPNQTEEFSAAIQSVLDTGNVDDIETAQRIAHTLKGAANVVGVRGIATLTHHLEDVLEVFSRHRQLPAGALADTLLYASDCLEMMSEALLGRGEEPDNALQIMQDVLDWANYLDREGVPQVDHDLQHHGSAQRIGRSAGEAPGMGMQPVNTDFNTESTEPTLRVAASQMDELLRLTGEDMIATSQVQEHINQLYASLREMSAHNSSLQQLAFDLEQLLDVQGVAARLYSQAAGGEFDSLEMDQYNELHTFSRKLVEAASDSYELTAHLQGKLAALEQIAYNQESLHQESREIILGTRMVSVSTIVPRLKRGVRQACRVTGKQAKLVVTGEDSLIDGSMLNELLDPLMHLLRNAVDHGIESEQVRIEQGKPVTGTVEFEFSSSGQQMSVICRDDGRGLDYTAIRKVAVEREILNPSDDIPEEQLNRLILHSGFSTRPEVTQTSGRGIGLDVVSAEVSAMKGSLEIRSISGKGTEVQIDLPGSMLTSNSLLIKVDNTMIAVSSRGIEELLSVSAGEILQQSNEATFHIEGAEYPVKYLDNMLNLPLDVRAGERSYRAMLLVRDGDGDGRTAVAVQEIVASRSVVVKGLGQYVPRLRGVIGATILGNGGVAPVIDLLDILHSPALYSVGIASMQAGEAEANEDPPYVLVADDSLSARRSLEQFITDIGMDVRSARDGVEALDVIQERLPDILLVDLEMPRMNGLELVAYIRANETTRHIPVIMITSRSTEKHRAQATRSGVDRYMVKPFSEDELMNNIQTLLEEAE